MAEPRLMEVDLNPFLPSFIGYTVREGWLIEDRAYDVYTTEECPSELLGRMANTIGSEIKPVGEYSTAIFSDRRVGVLIGTKPMSEPVLYGIIWPYRLLVREDIDAITRAIEERERLRESNEYNATLDVGEDEIVSALQRAEEDDGWKRRAEELIWKILSSPGVKSEYWYYSKTQLAPNEAGFFRLNDNTIRQVIEEIVREPVILRIGSKNMIRLFMNCNERVREL